MGRTATSFKILAALLGILALAAGIAFAASAALTRAANPQPDGAPTGPPPGAVALGQAAPAERSPLHERTATPAQQIEWRRSRSLGLPHAGRLAGGVQLPAEGRTFFTWDPILKQRPSRGWRRWGSDRLIRTLLSVSRSFARENPGAPRVAIGDLSRPEGGDFGPQYGSLGHSSHQNGLDADIYYPLRSGRERAPRSVSEVDLRLAQDLVDRFVRAGAVKVFVGPSTPLTGPPEIVQRLVHHDNHLHVRVAP